MAATSAQLNRQNRQENLREQLSQQKHVEQVIKNIKEIEETAFDDKGDDGEIDYKAMQAKQYRIQALKTANEQRLKLVNKYLPDLKNTEITGDAGGSLTISVADYSGELSNG